MHTRRSSNFKATIALFFVALGGCASFNSTEMAPKQHLHDGLVYYMPKRPIIIQTVVTAKTESKTTKNSKGKTVKVTKKVPVETASLLTVPTMADMSEAFVLNDENDLIAENHPNISVNEYGLLESVTGDQKSGLDAALTKLATAAGEITALTKSAAIVEQPSKNAEQNNCEIGKTYYAVLDPVAGKIEKGGNLCVFEFRVVYKTDTSLAPTDTLRACSPDSDGNGVCNNDKPNLANKATIPPWDSVPCTSSDNDPTNTSNCSGIFYKTDIAYVISLIPPSDSELSPTTFVASSPDHAPIAFLPVKRALAADNTVHLTFQDGILTGFEQDNSGELVKLLELPADVIDAYLTAVAQIFPKFVSDKNSETQLALADFQYATCREALAAYPEKGTADQQNTAMTQIKAMCPALASATSAN